MIATKLKPLSGEYPMTVGSFLKDKRKAVGLTQKEVAEKAGIGLPTYKQYERDGASPPLKNVTKLATVLQFQPIEIIEEAEDDQRTDDDAMVETIMHEAEDFDIHDATGDKDFDTYSGGQKAILSCLLIIAIIRNRKINGLKLLLNHVLDSVSEDNQTKLLIKFEAIRSTHQIRLFIDKKDHIQEIR